VKLNPSIKRKKITTFILFFIIGIIIGAAAFVAYKQFFSNEPIDLSFIKKTPKPGLTANPLDGTQAEKTLANRHPLAIIVENHPGARPQIGLDKASIIYEAITEGGITRFMAIYGPRNADKVGPVRSLRTFFLDWAHEYNAFLAHVGGNIDALDRVPTENVFDLDQFGLGEKAYWREPQAGKAVEHTMYTSIDLLYDAAGSKGYPMKADFEPFDFLSSENVSSDNVTKITIDFSSPSYLVSYTYDPANQNYQRSMAGLLHKDRATGNVLTPTNIIIQAVERQAGTTRINEDSWTFTTVGQGKAYVFYGGKKINATWEKEDLLSRTKFYDENNREIKFLPGQFWYEIVPPDVFDKVKIETAGATVQ
jgi:hypothetical protein